jgi:small-conductance mechanosensitive channel
VLWITVAILAFPYIPGAQRRAFRVGDRVKIGSDVGDVTSLGFFATKLRTIRNEELTLPNGQVASSAIVTYTRLADGPGLIPHTGLTIGYDVDLRTVHALLVEAGTPVEGIASGSRPPGSISAR